MKEDPRRRWTKEHSERRRDISLRSRFGIGLDEYNAMLSAQSGVCAICRRPETRVDPRTECVRALAVDHCHETGKVRALLCCACNAAIGLLQHDPQRALAIAAYVEANT
jgi:hypothetical protein